MNRGNPKRKLSSGGIVQHLREMNFHFCVIPLCSWFTLESPLNGKITICSIGGTDSWGKQSRLFSSDIYLTGRSDVGRHSRSLLIVVFILLATSWSIAQKSLTAVEAKNHIGEQGTVCGKVVSTRHAESSRGNPTFLNFDQPYPNQVFTMLIWGSDRTKFDEPETKYRGKQICVSGKISEYKGTPGIVASDPSQVKMQ